MAMQLSSPDEGWDEKVLEKVLPRIKMQVFQPSTCAASRLKVEVQLEVDSEHARDMFQV